MQDPFQPKLRALKPHEQLLVDNIKADAFVLLQKYPVGTRNATLARYKLEESIMWVVKDLTE